MSLKIIHWKVNRRSKYQESSSSTIRSTLLWIKERVFISNWSRSRFAQSSYLYFSIIHETPPSSLATTKNQELSCQAIKENVYITTKEFSYYINTTSLYIVSKLPSTCFSQSPFQDSCQIAKKDKKDRSD